MGNFLHRVGRFAFAHKWRVIGGWIALLVIFGLSAAVFTKPATNAISIPGTEAQKAIDRVGELFPDAGKGSGRIVFAAPTGKTIDDYKAQITDAVTETSKVSGVSRVVSPFENTAAISKDKTIAYAQVQLEGEGGSVAKSTIASISDITGSARAHNLTVEVGGDLVDKVPAEILGVGEIFGVVLALVVLLMTLGSLISAGMPIATAVMAVGVSMAGLFGLSQLITINATTPVLAVMLGLAVGIDYSLFIISKYRTYLLAGHSYASAAEKAVATAGNAVLFAAATVVIALSALTVVQIPFITNMGLVGAATIAMAAIISITLIPAMLGLAGARVFRGKTRRAIVAAQEAGAHDIHQSNHSTFWYRWGEAITKRPVVILVLAVAVIVVIAYPVRGLMLGLPTDEYAAKDTTNAKAYSLLSKGFGPGFNGPLLVVAEGLPHVTDADKAVVRTSAMEQYNAQVAAATATQTAMFQTKAAQVTTPAEYRALQQEIAAAKVAGEKQQKAALAQIEQNVTSYARLVQLSKVAGNIAKLDNVAQAVPASATDDGTKGIIQIIPDSAPSDAKTTTLINYLRDANHQKSLYEGGNITVAVTGSTALQNDINAKLSGALPVYLAVVVGLSLILLIVAFRSILVPIKATLGFLLSVLAMFGAMVAVFQWGWFGIAEAPAPIVSFIPIIGIGILFGLAMDYEFFLVSSMHEAYMYGKDAKKAVVEGFGLGSKVVTAAGIIMISVFSGFIANHDTTIQTIGFGLAVGILVDAFLVRMTIVPAVMTLLGDKAWWLPRWLNRIIPHVSIDGDEKA